jgi:hypothetical protein
MKSPLGQMVWRRLLEIFTKLFFFIANALAKGARERVFQCINFVVKAQVAPLGSTSLTKINLD